MSSEHAWNAIHSNSNTWPYCLTLVPDVCTMPCTYQWHITIQCVPSSKHLHFSASPCRSRIFLFRRKNIFYVTPNKIKLHLGMQPHYASPYPQNICVCMLYARWKSTFSVVIQHPDAFRAWKRNERTGKRTKQKCSFDVFRNDWTLNMMNPFFAIQWSKQNWLSLRFFFECLFVFTSSIDSADGISCGIEKIKRQSR